MFFDQHVYTNVYESVSEHIDQDKKSDLELQKWLERNITDPKYRERYLVAYGRVNKKSFY